MSALTLIGMMRLRIIFLAHSVHDMYTVVAVGMKFMDRTGVVLWKLLGIYSPILALVATLCIVAIAR